LPDRVRWASIDAHDLGIPSGRKSFRTDIPKGALPFKDVQVPKSGGKYVNTSLPQYQDVDAALKIIGEAIAKSAKK
jgi:hypothetical protein